MLDEDASRPREIAQRAELPRRVIHTRDVLVGWPQSGLLEEAEVVIVAAAGDTHERGVRIAMRDLEAEHVAIEAHAALDVRDPQHEMLQALARALAPAPPTQGAGVWATSAIDGGVAVSSHPAGRLKISPAASWKPSGRPAAWNVAAISSISPTKRHAFLTLAATARSERP